MQAFMLWVWFFLTKASGASDQAIAGNILWVTLRWISMYSPSRVETGPKNVVANVDFFGFLWGAIAS